MPDLAQLQLVIDSKQITTANSQLTILVNVSKDTEKAVAGVSRGFTAFISTVANATISIGGFIRVFKEIKDLLAAPLIAAAEFESTKAGFETILGSADKATKLLNDLRAFANQTPFEFHQLTEAAQQFIGVGFEAEEIIPILKGVGDAMFSLDKGAEGVQRATLALTQMKTAGRIGGQDMMQLTSQGVRAWKYLADAIGVTEPQIKKLVHEGVIDADEGIKVIVAGMEKQFPDGMKKAARLTKGLWSTLMDELATINVGIGEAIIEGFNVKGVLQETIDIVHVLGAAVVDFARALAGLEPKWEANKGWAKSVSDFVAGIWPNIEKGFFTVSGWVEKVFARIKYYILDVVDAVRGGIADIIRNIQGVIAAVDNVMGGGILGKGAGIAKYLTSRGITTSADAVNVGMMALSTTSEDLTKSYAQSVMTGKSKSDPAALTSILDAIDAQTELNKKFAETDTFVAAVGRGLGYAKETISDTVPGAKGVFDWVKNLSGEMEKTEKAAEATNQAMKEVDKAKLLRASDETILGVRTKGFESLRDLNTELMLVGKTKEEREGILEQMKLEDMYREKHINKDEYDNQLLKAIAETRKNLQTMQEIKGVADDIGKAFGDAFESAALEAKSFKDVVTGLIKDIEKTIFEALVRKPIQNFVSGSLTNLLGGIFGVGGPAAVGAPPGGTVFPGQQARTSIPDFSTLPVSWKGNIFGPNGLIPFAMGGVVNGPTLFPFARGAGLMGERGPEAIMPLSRGPDGKLGVKASGSKVTNVTMNVYTNDADSFRRSGRQIASGLRKAAGN